MNHFIYIMAAIIMAVIGIIISLITVFKNKEDILFFVGGFGFLIVYFTVFLYLFSILVMFEHGNSPENAALLPMQAELFLMALLKYGILFFVLTIYSLFRNLTYRQAMILALGFASIKLILRGLLILLAVLEDACSPSFLSTLSYYNNDFLSFIADIKFHYYWTLFILIVERLSVFFIDVTLIVIFIYAFSRKNIKLYIFVLVCETFINKLTNIFFNMACVALIEYETYKMIMIIVLLALILGVILKTLRRKWQMGT